MIDTTTAKRIRRKRFLRRNKNKILLGLVLLFAILLTTFFVINFSSQNAPNQPAVAAAEDTQHIGPESLLVNTAENNGLATAVKNALIGAHAAYGIAILNLKTHELYLSNEHRPVFTNFG